MRSLTPAYGLMMVALLIVPPATAAPYLQFGFDAARNGVTNDPGPALPEVAFEVQLAGERVPGVPPIVIDGAAYVLTRALEGGVEEQAEPRPDLGFNGLWRIDLATADAAPVLEYDGPPSSIASDGSSLFIATPTHVVAYDLGSFLEVWSMPLPRFVDGSNRRTTCVPGAVSGDLLYLGCTEADHVPARANDPTLQLPVVFDASSPEVSVVMAIRTDTGELVWQWDNHVQTYVNESSATRTIVAVSVFAAYVHIVTEQRQPRALGESPNHCIVRLVAQTGEWDSHACDEEGHTEANAQQQSTFWAAPPIVGDDERTFLLTVRVTALDTPTWVILWQQSLVSQPNQIGFGDPAMAYLDNALVVANTFDVYRLELGAEGFDIAWQVPHPGAAIWSTGQVSVANERTYATAGYPGGGEAKLTAIATDDGARLWQHVAPDASRSWNWPTHAVSDGLLVFTTWDGRVTVMGRTPASIQSVAAISRTYPAVGQNVTVDLSGTANGVMGGTMEYMVDWGDGVRSDWQDSPVFVHSFTENGDHAAELWVRNEAGQSSAESVVFHVGSEPPQDPTIVQTAVNTAFARENQDITFGILGILVALIGGLIAIIRRSRDHSRLQRELAAVDRAYELADGDPGQQEAVLHERRAHAKGLLVDAALTEAQYVVLERHIDELAQGVRLSVLEEFDFLPYGMGRVLEEMLRDGRISRWERERFLDGLEREERLTGDEKARVRQLVEGWFARDTGSATGHR